MLTAADRSRMRENTMRANGIPVSEWGADQTLMALYTDEIREEHRAILHEQERAAERDLLMRELQLA